MKILFMCMENSVLSPMAEGIAREIFKDQALIESIGLVPKQIHPTAIQVMRESGIEISNIQPKNMLSLSPSFFLGLKYFIYLEESEISLVLPINEAVKMHWPIPDPSVQQGSPSEQLEAFRRTREKIRKKIEELAQMIAKG